MENEKKSMSEGDDDNDVMKNEKESSEGDDEVIMENEKERLEGDNKDDDCYCKEADYYYTHGYQTVVWKGKTDTK